MDGGDFKEEVEGSRDHTVSWSVEDSTLNSKAQPYTLNPNRVRIVVACHLKDPDKMLFLPQQVSMLEGLRGWGLGVDGYRGTSLIRNSPPP